MAISDLVLGITGASGAIYGVRLLEVLLRAGKTVHLALSNSAIDVIRTELGRRVNPERFAPEDLLGKAVADDLSEHLSRLQFHSVGNFMTGIASGSFLTGGMAVVPCSMGTVAAIAHGLSQNLIHRAADVHLKERRKLILVPRETPLGLVQLRNLTACAEAGAVILPAMPGFYSRPQSIDELVDFVVGRVCDQLGVEHLLMKRWGAPST